MRIKNWNNIENRILNKMVKDGARVSQIARILDKNYHTVLNVLEYRGLKRINNEWIKV